jgi:serine O-acetyltransferase
VVTKDVPDHSVVVGIPGHVISQEGSEGYVNKTNYGEPPIRYKNGWSKF